MYIYIYIYTHMCVYTSECVCSRPTMYMRGLGTDHASRQIAARFFSLRPKTCHCPPLSPLSPVVPLCP